MSAEGKGLESAPESLYVDASILANILKETLNTLPWFDKAKNFAPIGENVFHDRAGNPLTLWYTVEQTRTKSNGSKEKINVYREIPPGAWFKIKPDGVPQALIHPFTRTPSVGLFADLDQIMQDRSQVEKVANMNHVDITVVPERIDTAISNIKQATMEKEGIEIDMSATADIGYAPERGRARLMRTPAGVNIFFGSLNDSGDLKQWGQDPQRAAAEFLAVVQFNETGEVYINSLGGTGTIQNFFFPDGRPITKENFSELPEIDRKILMAVAGKTAERQREVKASSIQ